MFPTSYPDNLEERKQRDLSFSRSHTYLCKTQDVQADWCLKSHLVLKHNPDQQRQGRY